LNLLYLYKVLGLFVKILTQNLLQSGERCREAEKNLSMAELRMKELENLNEEMSNAIKNVKI